MRDGRGVWQRSGDGCYLVSGLDLLRSCFDTFQGSQNEGVGPSLWSLDEAVVEGRLG